MTVGVLALQGDFEAHQRALHRLDVATLQVRAPSELAEVDGLVIPGGESTTMLELLDEEGLRKPLVEYAKPILGCCAGAILMASEVSSPEQDSLAMLDIAVERNGYGRQVHSGIRRLAPSAEFAERTADGEVEAVFIRAPIIRRMGSAVQTLLQDGDHPALVEAGDRLAATFHPELTDDGRVHRLLLDKIRDSTG